MRRSVYCGPTLSIKQIHKARIDFGQAGFSFPTKLNYDDITSLEGDPMKKIFLCLMLLSAISFGQTSATRPFTMVTLDTSVNNLSTGYDGANAQVFSNLSSARNLLIWNETGSNIGVSVPTGSSCEASSADNFVAPGVSGGGVGVAIENVSIIKVVCLKSLSGAAITSGTVYISTW